MMRLLRIVLNFRKLVEEIMISKLRRILSLKSIFSILMSSFLLIICISLIFHFFAYKLYTGYIEKEMINNSYQRMEVLANKLDSSFEQVQSLLLKIYMDDEFKPLSENKQLSPYEEKSIIDTLRSYANFNSNITNIFVLSERSNFVMTADGSYDKRKFFNTFYNNPIYNEEFWLKESKKNFYTNYYRADKFKDHSNTYNTSGTRLMPIVLKQSNYSTFIIVALVNVDSIIFSNENEFLNDFYIYNNANNSIYFTTEELTFDNFNKLGDSKQGYTFTRTSRTQKITYAKFLSNAEIKKLLIKINVVFILMVLGSIGFGLLVSIIISKKVNNPVEKIIKAIEGKYNQSPDEGMVDDLQFIGNGIQQMMSENMGYNKELSLKNSLLETFFYQSKGRDVYMYFNELKEQLTVKEDFGLICFKVHFKDKYCNEIGIESNKITFYLMELIKIYMKDYCKNSTAFQSESDEIIVIVGLENRNTNLNNIVSDIMDKLIEEEQYIFFTVAIGKVYRNISEFDKAFVSVREVLKYRKLIEETQILEEAESSFRNQKIYLPIRYIEQFTELLSNKRSEDCIKKVDEVLHENMKKEVGGFYINLICGEFINCCVAVLGSIEKEKMPDINLQDIHNRLNKCTTIKQCTDICSEVIITAVNILQENDKKRDYIVDFIKEYIGEHYNEDIYLELFAEKLNLTKEYISLYFKNKTGINLVNYLNEYRIEKAKDLLNNTDVSITEVGKKVGYTTPNNFSRIFKQYTGVSPKEYRQNINTL